MAQTKYVESQESLNKVCPDNKGKDILVPLTSSVSSYIDLLLFDSCIIIFISFDICLEKNYYKSGLQLRKSEQNGFHDNFLISQPNRDDFNECHIIGFSWEMRKLAFWKLSDLDLICCPVQMQKQS